MRTFLSIFLCFLSLCMAAGHSAGQTTAVAQDSGAVVVPPRSVFSINNVTVDVEAASAVEARAQALIQARRLAFSRLFEKLVAREDWSALPALTNAELSDLVRALDVTAEKTSTTQYIGAFTVVFYREKIIELFEDLNVTFTDDSTPPIALIPVLNYGGVPLLDSPDNVWALSWEISPKRAESIVDYVDAYRSPKAAHLVSAVSVEWAQTQTLIELMKAMNASDVLVVYADVALDLSTGQFRGQFDIRRGPQQSGFLSFALVQNAGEAPQGMLERAIAKIDLALSSLWKRQLLVQYATAREINLDAEFANPEEWKRIKRALSKSRQLRDIRTKTLGLTSASLQTRFSGGFSEVRAALGRAGLSVEETSADLWRITLDQTQDVMRSAASPAESIEGYIDPLADQLGEPMGGADGSYFDKAPWEINADQPPRSEGYQP